MASHLPPDELEARLRAFYDAHNPGNQQNIAEIVRKYHGKEAALCAKLQKKYGVAPELFPPTTNNQPTSPNKNPTTPTPTKPKDVPNKPVVAYDPSYKPFQASHGRKPTARDAALDFYATAFDALKALRARALEPPVGGLLPLDNIHKCRHLLPVTDPNFQKLTAVTAKKPTPKDSKATTATAASNAKPVEPQLFAALADTYLDGPFTLLRRCFVERRRVCVVVRRVNSVRGTLRGFLKAFDKHMNLVLLDVQQQWIPPAQYKTHDDAQRRARDHRDGDGAPLLSVADERRNRGFTTSSYAKQLFVRGDNVVMVLLDDAKTTANKTNEPATNQRRDYTPQASRR